MFTNGWLCGAREGASSVTLADDILLVLDRSRYALTLDEIARRVHRRNKAVRDVVSADPRFAVIRLLSGRKLYDIRQPGYELRGPGTGGDGLGRAS